MLSTKTRSVIEMRCRKCGAERSTPCVGITEPDTFHYIRHADADRFNEQLIHNAQGELIRSLCDNIRDSALAKVLDMPVEWDGHELRMYLTEQFVREIQSISDIKRNPRSKRAREYRRAVAALPR